MCARCGGIVRSGGDDGCAAVGCCGRVVEEGLDAGDARGMLASGRTDSESESLTTDALVVVSVVDGIGAVWVSVGS